MTLHPTPGAPRSWVTTEAFLDRFGLESLQDLPDPLPPDPEPPAQETGAQETGAARSSYQPDAPPPRSGPEADRAT